MSAIVIKDLTKKIRGNVIFQNMDLEVYDGEIFSLMGKRGSGKTTLLNLLFHFLKPNKGSISLLNMDVKKENKDIKELASFIPDEVWFYPNQKVGSIFKNTMRFYELQNIEEQEYLIDYFGLDTKTKFGYLDDESRKIAAIINALITKPQLLVIDEPANDLSHDIIDKFFSYISKRNKEDGMTILLMTEDLFLGQRYGNRAGYLVDGKVEGIEYLNDKESPDKILRIYGDSVDVDAFQSIGAHKIHQSIEETDFFYNDYLPTLTTVLHQQRIKSYSLEDASLEEKLLMFRVGHYHADKSNKEELIISSTKQMETVSTSEDEKEEVIQSDDDLDISDRNTVQVQDELFPVNPKDNLNLPDNITEEETIKIEPLRDASPEETRFKEENCPENTKDLSVQPEDEKIMNQRENETMKEISDDEKPAYRNTLVFKNDAIDQALREDNKNKGKE